MNILVGTPAGGGNVTTQYSSSIIDTMAYLVAHKERVKHQVISQVPQFDEKNPNHVQHLQQAVQQHTITVGVSYLGNESLLARGRNYIAAQALYGGYDKLFFIDADTGWTKEDFFKIVQSPHPIIAGIVPLKTYPYYPHDFRTSLNYLPYNEDEIHFDDAIRDLHSTNKMIEAHKANVIEVPLVGTAFLCINREVLMHLAELVPDYRYPDLLTGEPMTNWAFFDGGPVNGQYFSEDWAFCKKAREAGYKIMIDTTVVLNHTGTHTFRAM